MESRQRKKTWGRKLLLVLVVVAVVITLALQGSKEVKADPVVDVTGLEAGGVKSHDCDDYAVTKSNAAKHWYVCAVCGNEINSKKHPSAKHTMGKKTWANGKESCDKSNSYTQTCTVCGYKETGHKPCQWDGKTWNNQSGMYTHIRQCSVCNGDINYSYYYNGTLYNSEGTQPCKDKNGKVINCTNPGTCAVCGETTTLGLHDLYVNKGSHVISCYNGCGETFGTATWTLTCDDKAPNTYTWTIHYKLTGGAVFAKSNGVRNINKQVYEDEVSETVKYNNSAHTDVTVKKTFRFLNSRKTPYATFAWDRIDVKNTKGVMVRCNIKTNMESLVPDSQAPKITSAAIASADEWKQRKQITVTGTENWCNTVTIRLKKGNTVIYTGTATVSGGNYRLAFIPNLEEGETGSKYTIVVEDSCGNQVQKNLTIKKTDSIAPAVADTLATENKWSKTKDYTFKATDSGSGNVTISFNSTEPADYLQMSVSGTNFSKKYTFTGDVYSDDGVLAAVYFKDGIGNTTTKFIRIYKLDNTAPTITKCTYEEGVNEGTFTVTAHDVNSKLGKSGSGVAGYAVTTTKTAPDASKFQKAKTVKITSDGTYYLWAIDAAGNISAPVEKKATVKHKLTVNPNGGTWENSIEIQEFTFNEGRIRNINDADPEPQVGMKFVRWDFSTAARSVSTFNAATKRFTMGSSDATLKAKFEYIQYNLAYDFSGGAKAAGGSYPAKATYNTSFSVTPPVRSGYTFGGWTISGMNTHDDKEEMKSSRHYYSTADSYSDANSAYGVEACSVEAPFVWFKNLRSTLNDDSTEATVTFTAKWQKNEYSLIVDPNLGTWYGSTESQEIKLLYEEKTEIPDPVREGYTFTGWTLNGEGSSLNENTFTMGWENAVLVANWKVNHYVIHFDGNGATEGEMDDIPMIYDVPQKLPENKFVRETEDGESTFLGWSMDSGAKEAAYEDEEEVKNLTEQADETIVLYAIWDDCPWIEATDLYYPLEQAQSGYITLEELMSHATAGDEEDGDITAGEDAAKHTTFDIWDYLPEDFTSFDSSGSVTETYRVIDSVGNVTKKMITVYIVDTTPKNPEPIRTTRFINEKYYRADYENGGLAPDSIWLTNSEYRATIEQAFENLKNDTPLYEFHFSHETILQMKQFVQDNGFGNGKSIDALQRFCDTYLQPNRVDGSDL